MMRDINVFLFMLDKKISDFCTVFEPRILNIRFCDFKEDFCFGALTQKKYVSMDQNFITFYIQHMEISNYEDSNIYNFLLDQSILMGFFLK